MNNLGHVCKGLAKDEIIMASRQTWKAAEKRWHLSSIFMIGRIDQMQTLANDIKQGWSCEW